LTDLIWILLDHLGNVLGVSQSVSGGANFDCQNLKQSELEKINTFKSNTQNWPLFQTFRVLFKKMERVRDSRDRGEMKDNRGFFAKYWMNIVPVAILVLISGATNPEARAWMQNNKKTNQHSSWYSIHFTKFNQTVVKLVQQA
jgi:ER membrane protein complex subunit 10